MASRAKGMAFEDPFYGQYDPATDSVSLDSFQGILRTGRVKPTSGRPSRRNKLLINPNEPSQYLSHFFSLPL